MRWPENKPMVRTDAGSSLRRMQQRREKWAPLLMRQYQAKADWEADQRWLELKAQYGMQLGLERQRQEGRLQLAAEQHGFRELEAGAARQEAEFERQEIARRLRPMAVQRGWASQDNLDLPTATLLMNLDKLDTDEANRDATIEAAQAVDPELAQVMKAGASVSEGRMWLKDRADEARQEKEEALLEGSLESAKAGAISLLPMYEEQISEMGTVADLRNFMSEQRLRLGDNVQQQVATMARQNYFSAYSSMPVGTKPDGTPRVWADLNETERRQRKSKATSINGARRLCPPPRQLQSEAKIAWQRVA